MIYMEAHSELVGLPHDEIAYTADSGTSDKGAADVANTFCYLREKTTSLITKDKKWLPVYPLSASLINSKLHCQDSCHQYLPVK